MKVTPENFTQVTKLFTGYPKDFVLDDKNRPVIDQLCNYINRDSSFTGDLEKGVMLMGPIGCGKTYLMKVIGDMFIRSLNTVNCRKVASDFAIHGDEGLTKYISSGRTLFRYCFDDLGTEPDKVYYGSTVNVMAEVLLRRYDLGSFYKTFCTTNLTAEELKQRYGDRLTDRFREMFNVLTFDNCESRRV